MRSAFFPRQVIRLLRLATMLGEADKGTSSSLDGFHGKSQEKNGWNPINMGFISWKIQSYENAWFWGTPIFGNLRMFMYLFDDLVYVMSIYNSPIVSIYLIPYYVSIIIYIHLAAPHVLVSSSRLAQSASYSRRVATCIGNVVADGISSRDVFMVRLR
jgi:hypothetical protein